MCLTSQHCISANMMLRLALRYQLRHYGAKLTPEEAQVIENKQGRLQKLIDKFQHQADSFILHQHGLDRPKISPVDDYDQYDNVDLPDSSLGLGVEKSGPSLKKSTPRTSDGSGMDHVNPEDLPILLPSTLGWKWCDSHRVKSLASKEAQLRVAQANESIHRIRLALGFKSAIFRTQVRSAKSQQKKTRAWNAVKSVDTTVHEHARIYSMARDAYRAIRQALPKGPDLPQLLPKDIHVATLVLGSETTGQRNKQQSWIWGFGQKSEDDGTWMDDCK
jgi:hypothetical protein